MYFLLLYWPGDVPIESSTAITNDHGEEGHAESGRGDDADERSVLLPKEMQDAAKLKVETVTRRSITGETWATGKIMLNEDRTAHIYSITEGRVHKVLVGLGDRVKEGQVLAVIDSRKTQKTVRCKC